MTERPISIFLYEDNQELLFGLSYFFRSQEGFQLAGARSDCSNCTIEVLELKPDLVLMDIDMPGMNGIDGVRAIKSVRPETVIIMHTVFEDNEHIFKAIEAGASGYLLKKTNPEQLLISCREVINGGAVMTPSIARKVLDKFSMPPSAKEEFGLTDREIDVLRLLVNGDSYKMIAAGLKISIDTVRAHIKNIYEKLHVNSMTQAVSKAIRNRIVP